MIRPSSEHRDAIAGRRWVAAVCATATLLLTACAEMQMGQPKPSIDTTVKLRGAGMGPMAVGRFGVENGRPDGLDSGVSIRSNPLRSPVEGSFAQYLRETLRVELMSAGLLDASAGTVVSGELSDTAIETPIGIGHAALSARFKVTRAGAVDYDKRLSVEAAWDSPFLGAVAIPQAAGEYERLYRRLVGQLLDDPAFRKAVGRGQ